MELRSSYGVRRLTRAHLAELGQGAGGESTLPKRDGTDEPRSGSDVGIAKRVDWWLAVLMRAEEC